MDKLRLLQFVEIGLRYFCVTFREHFIVNSADRLSSIVSLLNVPEGVFHGRASHLLRIEAVKVAQNAVAMLNVGLGCRPVNVLLNVLEGLEVVRAVICRVLRRPTAFLLGANGGVVVVLSRLVHALRGAPVACKQIVMRIQLVAFQHLAVLLVVGVRVISRHGCFSVEAWDDSHGNARSRQPPSRCDRRTPCSRA